MSEIDAQLFQNFIEKLNDNNAKMEGVLQATKDTARWVENLDKSLHEEFTRTRVLTQKVDRQEGTLRVLDKRIEVNETSLKSHKDNHKWWAVFVVSVSAAAMTAIKAFWRGGN